MAFLGGVLSISLGKLIWGGLGWNVFNPALLGRAFLQASFPGVLTTWSEPQQGFFAIDPRSLAMPFMRVDVDVVSAATPLGLSKFDHVITEATPLFLGNTSGSLGETSAVIIIICGLYLAIKNIFNWRLTVSTILSVFVLSTLLNYFFPEQCAPGTFMVLSGGLLFGAVFMVTDPVTTPITNKGMWIFGIGVGVLVVLIRSFGGLPEGVMFSILLMNSVTPIINRLTQRRQFGGQK